MKLFASCSSLGALLNVEVINPAWMKTGSMQGLLTAYPVLGPAFDTAFTEITQRFPRLNVSQHLIYNNSYDECTDWAEESTDKEVGEYYFSRDRRAVERATGRHILTAFILGGTI